MIYRSSFIGQILSDCVYDMRLLNKSGWSMNGVGLPIDPAVFHGGMCSVRYIRIGIPLGAGRRVGIANEIALTTACAAPAALPPEGRPIAAAQGDIGDPIASGYSPDGDGEEIFSAMEPEKALSLPAMVLNLSEGQASRCGMAKPAAMMGVRALTSAPNSVWWMNSNLASA
jgi:hypothetical protein